jgi:hypothetical protein
MFGKYQKLSLIGLLFATPNAAWTTCQAITADGCELGADGWSLGWRGAGDLPLVEGDYK